MLLGGGPLESGIDEGDLIYHFTVHEIRKQDPGRLLADPVLAPFAPLARVLPDERPGVLVQALNLIAGVRDELLRASLGRAAVTLAGVRLEAVTIDHAWKESDMPIPSILDERFEDGREEGLEQMTASLVLARFGSVDPERLVDVVQHLLAAGAGGVAARVLAADSLDDLV